MTMTTTMNSIIKITSVSGRKLLAIVISVMLALAALAQVVESGGKGGKKGKGGNMEDIILYNGNIVMRGDESGGSIVMAGMHPTNEEVEFSPSFFTGGGDMDGMEGFGRRRRR